MDLAIVQVVRRAEETKGTEMKLIGRFQAWLVRRRWRTCSHPNATERFWRDADGTLMRFWFCPDCNEMDRGHVHE